MATYITIIDYIGCSQSTVDKIARINAIIEALEDSLLLLASNADVEEYRLDDGQTVIKTIFREPSLIEDAISKLNRRRTRLINRCHGFRYNLTDGNVIT